MLSTGTIEADGAHLYSERRGDGSPLLLIPGGVGNSSTFSAVAGTLAWDHTVLSYDRRSFGRSRLLPGAGGALRMAQQSADARAVIERNGFGSAAVPGSSAGALIGLDLAARCPAPCRPSSRTSAPPSSGWRESGPLPPLIPGRSGDAATYRVVAGYPACPGGAGPRGCPTGRAVPAR
jgi:hypothetical protein